MTGDTLALVGAVGGAGTTRLTVECAGTLARSGRSVAILDAAYGTQGLQSHVRRRPNPDLTTALLADDVDLAEALLPLALEAPGSVRVAPASAPFERLARAKHPDAARAFEQAVAAAAIGHDVVLIDTPPVAANQAVAAVSTADRVAVVAPDSARGRDGLARVQGRLRDVGARCGTVVATAAPEAPGALENPDVRVSALPGDAAATPTTVDPTATGAPAVAAVVAAALGVEVETPAAVGRFDELLGRGG